MKVTSLTLNQMRGIEQAEFQFQPGMNLIVGVNGAGKSSVLDALRVMLSRTLPRLTGVKMRQESFSPSDITNGRGSLTAQLQIALGGQTLEQLIHLPRERYAETEQIGAVRDQTYGLEPRDELTLHTPDGAALRVETRKDLAAHLKLKKPTPLAIYFSTRRSLYSEAVGSQSERSGGGPTFAFADALRPRELRIREFTSWWRVQEEIGSPERLEALRGAVLSFLDDFSDVRVIKTNESDATMELRKGQRTLGVSQLSDGERGMLSLVLDVARRLALANPTLDDPLREGQAVILIDEIDLHLHPRWQRSVVSKLAATFPQCQFIATTHSPQVIGEAPIDSLMFMEITNERVHVRPSGQSFGLDTNWILEHFMDTPARNQETQQQLNRVEQALEEGELDLAREELEGVRNIINGIDHEVIRLEASINNLEALADEVDTEEE